MIWWFVAGIVVTAVAFFVFGYFYAAAKTPEVIAKMTPEELKALATLVMKKRDEPS